MTQANQFEVSNNALRINYSGSSLDGKPQMTVTIGQETKSFHGNQIKLEHTAIGTLATVTFQAVPDLKTVLITLLLPQVNIPAGKARVGLRTKAIETTVKTSIAGPGLVSGALQSYTTYALRGYAQAVEF